MTRKLKIIELSLLLLITHFYFSMHPKTIVPLIMIYGGYWLGFKYLESRPWKPLGVHEKQKR